MLFGRVRRVIDKIRLEITCYRADHNPLRMFACVSCFEMYPPSFYIRYTSEQQREVFKRDKERILELLDTLH